MFKELQKSKLVLKILIDIIMVAVYLFLMFGLKLGTTILSHEFLGVVISILFLAHIYLNKDFISNFLYGRLSGKNNLNGALDVLLLASVFVVILTGVLIARELFALPFNMPIGVLFSVHNIASYFSFALIILHILLHLKYLGAGILHTLKNFSKGYVKLVYLSAAGLIIVNLVLYSRLDRPDYSYAVNEISDGNITEVEEQGLQYEQDVENTLEVDVIPTLEEYLSNLTCTACGRGCSLLQPACRRGDAQVQKATEEYNITYSAS